jgi:D-lyxose ketol-isomerase
MNPMSRREMVSGVIAGGAAMGLARSASAADTKECKKMPLKFSNADFYTADGTFKADTAKEAYYELMRWHNSPIVPRLKTEDFWTLDFGLGNFLEAGMAGIFWCNVKEFGFNGHEIYLLPGQAIPEHCHLATDMPAKMEGWNPRHGMIYCYGEGPETPGVADRLPPMHRDIAKARNEITLMPGEYAGLKKVGEWHFMKAGPEGAIVSEYATYHDMAGLRFTHPKAKV